MKLIQGGLVKTITGGDIENGQILIDGGKIVAVGQNLDVPAGTEIIDAAGCIVTPGFVDAVSYTHLLRHALGQIAMQKDGCARGYVGVGRQIARQHEKRTDSH